MHLRLEFLLLTGSTPLGISVYWCTHSSSRLPVCSGADAAQLVAVLCSELLADLFTGMQVVPLRR